MRASIKDVGCAQEWGQLSLTRRTEQHSREGRGRKVCVRYCSHPALAAVPEEKLLGCIFWNSSMLHCESRRLSMTVHTGLRAGGISTCEGFSVTISVNIF